MKQGLRSRGGGRVRKRRAEFKYKGAQKAVWSPGSFFYSHHVIIHKTLYILIVLVATQYRVLSKRNAAVHSSILYDIEMIPNNENLKGGDIFCYGLSFSRPESEWKAWVFLC